MGVSQDEAARAAAQDLGLLRTDPQHGFAEVHAPELDLQLRGVPTDGGDEGLRVRPRADAHFQDPASLGGPVVGERLHLHPPGNEAAIGDGAHRPHRRVERPPEGVVELAIATVRPGQSVLHPEIGDARHGRRRRERARGAEHPGRRQLDVERGGAAGASKHAKSRRPLRPWRRGAPQEFLRELLEAPLLLHVLEHVERSQALRLTVEVLPRDPEFVDDLLELGGKQRVHPVEQIGSLGICHAPPFTSPGIR